MSVLAKLAAVAMMAINCVAPKRLPVECHWIQPPRLVLCLGATIDVGRFVEAYRWTEEKGAKWGDVSVEICSPDDSWRYGVVRILPIDPGEDAWFAGLTEIQEVDGWAMGADIILKDGDDWVPEHELLHAQCLGHATGRGSQGHVMNPGVDNGGWKAKGITDALWLVWNDWPDTAQTRRDTGE